MISPGEGVGELVEALAPGQVGCLRGGVFREDVVVRRPGVVLRSVPGQRATLLGRLVVARGAAGAVVRGLRLDSSAAPPDDSTGVAGARLPSPTVNAPDVAFIDNEVTGADRGYCFALGHPDFGRADRVRLEGNRIHDCGIAGSGHGHGVYVSLSAGAVITGNVIVDNEARGVQLYPDADRAKVTFNTIDGNGSGVIFAGDESGVSDGNLVAHNVIANARRRWNVESWYPLGVTPATDNTVRDNCLWGGRRGEVQRATALGLIAHAWWAPAALGVAGALGLLLRRRRRWALAALLVTLAGVPLVVGIARLRHD